MTCFIAYPTVCVAYAKCHGWQETLARFFVKSRRSASIASHHRLTPRNILTDTKDQHINSDRENATSTEHVETDIQTAWISSEVFEKLSNLNSSTQQLDVSPNTDDNIHEDSNGMPTSRRKTLLSTSDLTSMNLSLDNTAMTPEFFRWQSEEFNHSTVETTATSIQSPASSHEDLLSIVKAESLNNAFTSIPANKDVLSQISRSPTATTTSIKHLYSDEENNEQSRRLGSEVRQILGWNIGLIHKKKKKLIAVISLFSKVNEQNQFIHRWKYYLVENSMLKYSI